MLGFTLIHISIVTSVPWLQQSTNLVLLILLTLSTLKREKEAMVAALACGYLLDLYSALPFGVMSISLAVALATHHLFQTRLLKQHATHAIVINTAVATVAYYSFFGLAVSVLNLTNRLQLPPTTANEILTSAAMQTLVHAALLATLFFVISLGAKRIMRRSYLHFS